MERRHRVLRLRQQRQPRPLRDPLCGLQLPEQALLRRNRNPACGPTVTPTILRAPRTSCITITATEHLPTFSAKAGIANPQGKGLGVSFADSDGDGFTDIFVANASVPSFLYHNSGNGTFTEVGLTAGVTYKEDGKAFAGMGIDFSDFDSDGRPDIIVTDFSNERYHLFHNNGDGSFRDVTNSSGLGGATFAVSGWSTHLFDYDNDGWKDLFVAQGHVTDTIERTSPNMKYLEPPLLLKNGSGRFVRVVAGDIFQKEWAGRGAAFGDIDNHGDLDIVVSNVGQSLHPAK